MSKGRKKNQAAKGEIASCKTSAEHWDLAWYGDHDRGLLDLIFLVRSIGTEPAGTYESFPEIQQRVIKDDQQNEQKLAEIVLKAVKNGDITLIRAVAKATQRCAEGMRPNDLARVLINEYVAANRAGITPMQRAAVVGLSDQKIAMKVGARVQQPTAKDVRAFLKSHGVTIDHKHLNRICRELNFELARAKPPGRPALRKRRQA